MEACKLTGSLICLGQGLSGGEWVDGDYCSIPEIVIRTNDCEDVVATVNLKLDLK